MPHSSNFVKTPKYSLGSPLFFVKDFCSFCNISVQFSKNSQVKKILRVVFIYLTKHIRWTKCVSWFITKTRLWMCLAFVKKIVVKKLFLWNSSLIRAVKFSSHLVILCTETVHSASSIRWGGKLLMGIGSNAIGCGHDSLGNLLYSLVFICLDALYIRTWCGPGRFVRRSFLDISTRKKPSGERVERWTA